MRITGKAVISKILDYYKIPQTEMQDFIQDHVQHVTPKCIWFPLPALNAPLLEGYDFPGISVKKMNFM